MIHPRLFPNIIEMYYYLFLQRTHRFGYHSRKNHWWRLQNTDSVVEPAESWRTALDKN